MTRLLACSLVLIGCAGLEDGSCAPPQAPPRTAAEQRADELAASRGQQSGENRQFMHDCRLSWVPPPGWSPVSDLEKPWLRWRLLGPDQREVAVLSVFADEGSGRDANRIADDTAKGLAGSGYKIVRRGTDVVGERPPVPWVEMSRASKNEVWWFLAHEGASIAVACITEPDLLPQARQAAISAMRTLRGEARPEDRLLDPAFQVMGKTVDESRRVRVPDTPLSLVLPSDWTRTEPVTYGDLLGCEGRVGAKKVHARLLVQREEHFTNPSGKRLAATLPLLVKNGREHLGLNRVVQQGSFVVSGREAIYLEGTGILKAPKPEAMRFVEVFVADGNIAYMLTIFTSEAPSTDLQPIVLEMVHSLRFESQCESPVDPRSWLSPQEAGAPGALPGAPVVGDPVVTPSGLQYFDLAVGSGPTPASKQARVRVHYTGWLADGRKFASSHDRGQPSVFALNGVIPGWTEGILSMRQGGKRKLLVPSGLGYGPKGAPPTIPPNASLVFDVELIEVLER